MVQPEKFATPFTAGTALVHPANAPAPVPPLLAECELMDNVTAFEAVVTTLLFASSTDTTGCTENGAPSSTLPTGSVVNTSWFAEPALMTTAFEGEVWLRPVAVASRV
jgi:hypothetical protein